MSDDGAERDRARMAAAFEYDPGRSWIVAAIGTKGSGKSESLRQLFDRWPTDRVVIDVTGDARPDDPDHLVMTAPFKPAMPNPPDGAARVTVWARCDPRRDNYTEDQDDALGMALYPRHRPAIAWVDEYPQMATATHQGRNLRLALQSSRHYHMSLLVACQRPRTIPVLTLHQADRVFIFEVPIDDDRDYIAKNIGVRPAQFEQQWTETMNRGDHSFLLWDKTQKLLIGCPKLPNLTTHGPRA